MRILLRFSLLAAICAYAGPSLQADDDFQIIYRASGKKNPFVSAQRAVDTLQPGYVMPALRAQYDGYIYRYDGWATIRHDEVSSHVISFYITLDDPMTFHFGHSLAPAPYQP